ncbi:hypothetical protein CANCADRAFT_31168 [Tortispora caseinolytica NRRL Y-17796]|uniref:FAD/NAD(P)-binding domain-containing protein n=1 Tax=Tortispora caseinolytica NRRL Y-17796 TaxID=767744 RepID=A0A1E4TEB8_9ASCO|nr:hypothetical protein CANCADRAFT_31168 [Tortispora caseinolytica NRRL Y-17796]
MKRVGIIGGGPSGIIAIRCFLSSGFDVVVFERRRTAGGLWNYTAESCKIPCPSTDPWCSLPATASGNWDSAMYDSLDTNIPKQLMDVTDFPFDERIPMFPERQDVLEYMNAFAEPYLKYVRFNTLVESVDKPKDKWVVVSKDLDSGKLSTSEFDYIVVASGNYDMPYIPEFEGLKEWNEKYPGSVLHSRSYRSPDTFYGKTIVVGNSASGLDISYQISNYAELPVIRSIRSESRLPGPEFCLTPEERAARIRDVGVIKRFDYTNRSVVLADGEVIENVQFVVFATGYLKNIPFLQNYHCTHPLISANGTHFTNIYKQLLNVDDPSLAFLAAQRFILPMRIAEVQSAWLARVWNGDITLPQHDVMLKDYNDRLEAQGDGKEFHDLKKLEDVQYYRELQSDCATTEGFQPKPFTDEDANLRANVKMVKTAYLDRYREEGVKSTSIEELMQAGYLKDYQ